MFVKNLKIEKLEPKFEKGKFVRYPKDSLRYYVHFLDDQKVLICKLTIFLEEAFI